MHIFDVSTWHLPTLVLKSRVFSYLFLPPRPTYPNPLNFHWQWLPLTLLFFPTHPTDLLLLPPRWSSPLVSLTLSPLSTHPFNLSLGLHWPHHLFSPIPIAHNCLRLSTLSPVFISSYSLIFFPLNVLLLCTSIWPISKCCAFHFTLACHDILEVGWECWCILLCFDGVMFCCQWYFLKSINSSSELSLDLLLTLDDVVVVYIPKHWKYRWQRSTMVGIG